MINKIMCRTLSTLTSQGRYSPHPISEQLRSLPEVPQPAAGRAGVLMRPV